MWLVFKGFTAQRRVAWPLARRAPFQQHLITAHHDFQRIDDYRSRRL